MSIVSFDHITKTYRLGSRTSLREAISNSFTDLTNRKGKSGAQYINSLDDVSFEIHEGEVLGLIGANGAGKTTALKLLSKVTFPTKGQICIGGRVSALIELGAGFHPDLSGIENIYLNASILGLKKAETDKKLEQIIEFSGLKGFLDTPVKRYSSGMYARLAFSIAAHVDPDVLLVDEVLSVGDAIFQEKCFKRMKEIRDQGRVMIFVSHNMISVQSICTRVIWLEKGKIRRIGSPADVISGYLAEQYSGYNDIFKLQDGENLHNYSNGSVELDELMILDENGNRFGTINGGSGFNVKMKLICKKAIQELEVKIYITDKQRNRLFGGNLSDQITVLERTNINGELNIVSKFDMLPLRPDNYFLNVDVLNDGNLIYRKLEFGPIIVWSKNNALMPERFEEFNLFNVNCDWQLTS